MGPHILTPMFRPRAIAVFGASDNEKSVGGRVFRNLIESGFEGALIPINPKHKSVQGRTCYKTIGEVDDDIDLALIATPAATVEQVILECGAAHVSGAVVLSAGFSETGEAGKRMQTRLVETARRVNVRVLGPNCVGLVLPWAKANASFLNQDTPRGKLALVSQSGALCSAISDWAGPNHLGFSALVSLGNAADLGFGDVLSYLAQDANTSAILLYIEGIADASSFLSALRAAARSKPVVVLKSGRHDSSAKAATTHTGALMGADAVFEAALERAGAVRALSFGQLFAAAELLGSRTRAAGNRLCIITNGGGAGVLAADRAGDLDIALPQPSAKTKTALDAILPPFWSHGNPVDILGDAAPEIYGKALKLCLDDPAFDGVLVMLTPQAMTRAGDAADAVKEVFKASKSKKPVLACWMGETSVSEARTRMSAAGIPDFTTPERAVEAFSYLAQHERNQRLSLETPGPSTLVEADIDGAHMIIESALATGRKLLSDIESKAVLRAFHIPTVQTIEADTPEEALIAAQTLGFPVAMKISSPQISHKSDVDGVLLNLTASADIRPGFQKLVSRVKSIQPDATITGVTMEPMVRVADARELVVGADRDPVFGPSILFGAGGTMVEVLKDSAVALPPLTTVLAERLISRTRVAKLLEAFRNRPPVKREAVIEVLLRVSEMLAELPQISALDINPLLAGPDGVLAVDARISIARPAAGSRPYEHMAIGPYPRQLVENDHLADGSALTIRPIRPEDAESEVAFVHRLSDETKRFRFMHTLRELTPTMLARFTQIDYRREMALVAMVDDGSGGGGVQQGVARYVINPDGTSCEFAVVVSDEMRHKGIGSRLMESLMGAARLHGLKLMEGEVLADNRTMLKLMQEMGFTAETSSDDTSVIHVQRWL